MTTRSALGEQAAITSIAKGINVPLEAFLAVIEVESGGKLFAKIGSRDEPLIRFEGHYFDRLIKPALRDTARKQKLASPGAGTIKNPKSQLARWQLVQRAAQLDPSAAYQSTSWGIGQVMGAHWQWLGYESIDAFVARVRSGLTGQAEVMARYIQKAGLDDELRALDWSGFARGYNGPSYQKHGYHTKLAAAYARLAPDGSRSSERAGMLRLGSKGAGVRELQAILRLAGYPIVVDGDFGPTTRDAVRALQAKEGIKVDGVVGPATQEAIAKYRAGATPQPGAEPAVSVPGVKPGLVVSLLSTTLLFISDTKSQLEGLLTQLANVPLLAPVTEHLGTAIGLLTLAGAAGGAGLAILRWWQSRQTFDGLEERADFVWRANGKVGDIVLPSADSEQLSLI